MRHLPRALAAIGAGFAVSLIAACGGGSGLLSVGESNSLSQGLDQVSSAVQAGDCAAAHGATASLKSQVQSLPPTINRTLSNDLSQGVSTVSRLAVLEACQATAAATITTTTTSTSRSTASTTTTAPTTTTTTAPTQTTVTTSTSTSTPTSPTSTSTAPTGGGGLGGGQGQGGGASAGGGGGSQ